jgi:hypothetical protein
MCLQWSLAISRSGCAPSLTFTYNELVFWPCGVGQDIIGFDHGCSLSIGNSKIIRSLRRISWRWWKDTVQCVLSALCEPTRQECATGTYNMALLWGLHSADQLQRCSLTYVYNQQVSQNVSGGDEKASGESC